MYVDRHKGAARVKFEPPLAARYMSIDGTFCAPCKVIDASDSGSQLEFENSAAPLTEFFLVLTSSPTPVFRRCRRVWINGNRMGVEYQRRVAGKPGRAAVAVQHAP
jgi:hypothetical protein